MNKIPCNSPFQHVKNGKNKKRKKVKSMSDGDIFMNSKVFDTQQFTLTNMSAAIMDNKSIK